MSIWTGEIHTAEMFYLQLHTTTDMQRIPGEIVNVTGVDKIKFYKVAGIIKHAFHLGDLAAYTGEVRINKSKIVSVRQAALQINAANRFTVNRC